MTGNWPTRQNRTRSWTTYEPVWHHTFAISPQRRFCDFPEKDLHKVLFLRIFQDKIFSPRDVFSLSRGGGIQATAGCHTVALLQVGAFKGGDHPASVEYPSSVMAWCKGEGSASQSSTTPPAEPTLPPSDEPPTQSSRDVANGEGTPLPESWAALGSPPQFATHQLASRSFNPACTKCFRTHVRNYCFKSDLEHARVCGFSKSVFELFLRGTCEVVSELEKSSQNLRRLVPCPQFTYLVPKRSKTGRVISLI